MGDRFYPPYINEGLPFALKHLTEICQEQSPDCRFELSLPSNWRSPVLTDSSIVLNILEDLLRIKKVKTLFNNLVFIALEQNQSSCKPNNQLKVMFLGEKKSMVDSDRTELQYLQQIFQGLISGRCSNVLTEDSDAWLFEW